MLIRTYADIEKLKGKDALSPSEKTLIENCKLGEPTVLGDGTRPNGPSPQCTIRADLLRYLILGGCEQCRLHEKGVELAGAWLEGQLDMSFASAKGAVHLLQCAFAEPIVAHHASFDRLVLNGSSLPGLKAEGATIKGNVFLRNLKSNGEVSFADAEIGRQLSCSGAELNGGEGKALNAQGATVRAGVYLKGLKSLGKISFCDAQIGGQFSCEGAEIRGWEGEALDARGSKIKEDVVLRQLRSFGEVSFSDAEISGCLLCEDAWFNCPDGYAFDGSSMTVKDAFVWRGVNSVSGTVNLCNGRIGEMTDDESSWMLASKFILVGMSYNNLVGPLSLPFRMVWLKSGLRGRKFDSQSYEQLAKIYAKQGHYSEARDVLIEMEIEGRKAARVDIRRISGARISYLATPIQAVLFTTTDWILSLFVASKYKPWLKLFWLAAMISIMSPVAQLTWNAGDFAPNSAVVLTSAEWRAVAEGSKRLPASKTPAIEWADVEGQDYETFFAFAYAVDVVVPVLDLGQTNAWAPSPARGDWGTFLFYLQKLFAVLGWAVTAIVAADISGMIRRDD